MPFTPIRLLILFDNQRGYCEKIIPRLKEMLEQRAFAVDLHAIQDGEIDVEDYRGMIIGSPSLGLGIKGAAPTPEMEAYVRDVLPDLDDMGVAVFVVFELHPGTALDRMKGMVLDKGADVVAAHEYGLFRLDIDDHTIPAECMIRIR